jgi:ABC-type nickel/cobalt efflux system permease component RcnA
VGGGLSWRNLAYALQWWVFALFAAYMWWRMVRDDYEDGRDDHNHIHNHDSHHGSAPADGIGKATYV